MDDMDLFDQLSSDYFYDARGEKIMIEDVYQAFKKRLIKEIKVSGNSYQGVVYGQLESKTIV